MSVNSVVSALEVSMLVVPKGDLDVIQDVTTSAVVPAMVFFAVPGVFYCVSVCIVGVYSWFELIEHVCEVGVGADERCECKFHDEVEARLMLRLQWA